jgi:hypothetical protein
MSVSRAKLIVYDDDNNMEISASFTAIEIETSRLDVLSIAYINLSDAVNKATKIKAITK